MNVISLLLVVCQLFHIGGARMADAYRGASPVFTQQDFTFHRVNVHRIPRYAVEIEDATEDTSQADKVAFITSFSGIISFPATVNKNFNVYRPRSGIDDTPFISITL